jgi:hypothetical protein
MALLQVPESHPSSLQLTPAQSAVLPVAAVAVVAALAG